MERDSAWLLTPSGPGAIAVVRLCGRGVPAFLSKYFSRPCAMGRCVHGELCDENGAIIDDPVIVCVNDTTAEINLHGGGAVVRATLDLAVRAGFSEARPDTSFDAHQQWIDHEVETALSLPLTKLGLSVLLAQPQLWAAKIWTRESIQSTLADRSLFHLLHPPTVALIGTANAGKSTLANVLFGQRHSIVYDQPGTTRDYVRDLADLDGLPIHLIDTPGRRETDDSIEFAAIERSRDVIDRADLKILVLDPTQPATKQAALMMRYIDALRIASKSDQEMQWQPYESLSVSAKTAAGVDDLIQAIRSHFLPNGSSHRPLCWTDRQRRWLEIKLR